MNRLAILTCLIIVIIHSVQSTNLTHLNVTNGTSTPEPSLFENIINANISNSFLRTSVIAMFIVLLSELGDKSFFITVIMAMNYSRLIVFVSALLALESMTMISAFLGRIITKFVPKIYVFYASTILFGLFGLKMLYEAYNMKADEPDDESEEQQLTGNGLHLPNIAQIFIKCFLLIFVAEWGDRSQISIILLGARSNIIGTILGCSIGNIICTTLAVVGGRFVAEKISVRIVTFIGALFFLGFCIVEIILTL